MTAASGYLRFPHVVGDQVVFTAEDDVWSVSSDGGRASRLTADGAIVSHPRLSPDGAWLAWVSRRAGSPEVFVMPAGGGDLRQLTWFGHASTAVVGYDPAGRLLVISAGGQPFRSHVWGYAIDVRPGADATPQRLPYGPVTAIAHGTGGAVVVGTGYLRDPAHWKRYRGGTAGRLWSSTTGDGEFAELLGELAGPKTNPSWVGDRLAFLGDFEGHGNVYSVAADGSDLRRHTDHERFYARKLAGDGARLAYQHAGQVWLLESLAADSQPRRLDVTLGSPRSGRATVPVEVAKHLGGVDVDHTGRVSVLAVRGSVVRLTHRDGPAEVLASTPGVRYRFPVIAGDAVAFVSDAEGPDAIEVRTAEGTSRYAAGEIGRVLELVASPDGTTLALATHDGRVLTLAVADGTVTELERTDTGDSTGLAFSPDSRWLAFSARERTPELRSIHLVELASGTVTAVTEQRFDDDNPVFSVDGKYLAFLSRRTFDPVYDVHSFDLSFPIATRPYLVTLAAGTPSPFDPELDGRPVTSPKAETAGTEVTVTVDVDGIAERVVPFPVAAGDLADLTPVQGGFIWTDTALTGELGEGRLPDADTRPSLQRWDFATAKLVELAERVDSVAVSGDGGRLVLRDKDALKVVPSIGKPAEDGADTVTVDLDRIRLTVDPPAEWRQMLDETGRLMREHYWIADLAGIDWDAEVAKYRPLIDQVATRDDVSDLLWEVNGETGSSHAYETPPEPKTDAALKPAFLGADLSRDADGRWVIARILTGDNSSRQARSPLTAPGVTAAVGDALVSVDGRPVGATGPAPLLLGTADKPVRLVLDRGGEQLPVVVVPISNEQELRYLDWVSARRAIVHAATAGRVGYVHVPDMVATGWAAFHRDLRVEMERSALIVDTRNNSGGHTSQLVIEKLNRRVLARTTNRHRPGGSYPETSPQGPLVSLANEWSGSDGDIVNAAFQSLRLGPVIGTRTWGGVIGIDGRYKLVDGTGVTQPRYSYWFLDLGWSVENYGVDPDQVVEFPPHAWAAGDDPQLQAGIVQLLADLDNRPAPPMPDLSGRPNRAAPPLPPRS